MICISFLWLAGLMVICLSWVFGEFVVYLLVVY